MSEKTWDGKELKITIKIKGEHNLEGPDAAELVAIYAVKQAMKCFRWGLLAKVDEELGDIRFHTWDTPDGYVCEVSEMTELEQEFYHLKKQGKIDEDLGIDELCEKLMKAGDITEY